MYLNIQNLKNDSHSSTTLQQQLTGTQQQPYSNYQEQQQQQQGYVMTDPVSELNRRNIAAAGQVGQPQDYSIPYGQQQQPQPMQNGGVGYSETNGWRQDEYGQWHQDLSRNTI